MSPRTGLLALKAAWPLLRRALLSGQLFQPRCELTPPHPDILCEYEVEIPVADGIVLTANIFRSHAAHEQGARVPAVMCAHPYDNRVLPALGKTPFRGAPKQYRIIPQAGRPRFSTLTSWESPDPNFWVPAGYAVVNLNLPGYGSSGGPPTVFSDHQAKCYYEAIEWIARQNWCSGRVGLNGVSYLAITQYHVAACRYYGGPPPSLRCICPWEGFTDLYRDVTCPGGLEDRGFGPFWWAIEVEPALNATPADFVKHNGGLPMDLMRRHPLFDDFWHEKAAKLDQITVPMLVCASFSDHGLHTAGSFRAFAKAKSPRRWMYTHRGGKWDVYYSSEVQQLTRQFMDCFLKDDVSSGFLNRAPVRLEVRASRDDIHAVRDEQQWPLARTQYAKLHLLARPRRLDRNGAPASRPVEHSARRGRSTFPFRFDHDTELTGHMKLRLWVQAKPARAFASAPDDMAIFVAVSKRDRRGRVVHFRGSVGNANDLIARGFCRVSRRELDARESTDYLPVLTGTSIQPLEPDQIVPVEIELYPSSTFFAAGELLELIISATEIIPSPPYAKDRSMNRGVHVFHCGGSHDSHLLIPVIPDASGTGATERSAVRHEAARPQRPDSA
jgi:putative CocE/NonD family hydrolase